MTIETSRPGGVTFVASLCAVFGILELVAGVIWLIVLPDLVEEGSAGSAYVGWSAAILIALGIAYLLVSRGLYRGSDFARFVVALVSVLHVVNGLWLAFTGQLIGGLVVIAIAIFICSLLWTGRGAEFFARKTLSQ
ncbi:hypothetical protein B0I08_102246 [Glaciihabitans tibetensis]|uniref:Uncharacterized protein n=1 Tax=Glaciihabitans tibetensis TaxID=1266600 RepID=A0A2T0VH93_9MICO|nr:hypothetical protein [Glaciihabitans tibetensis]PRY69570.1 hypothetical protein B0I08_102246 [Glaciihabitans tibetensis]